MTSVTAAYDIFETFSDTLNNLPQGICVFDGERRLVVCNTSVISFLQLPDNALNVLPTHERFLAHCTDLGISTESLAWFNAQQDDGIPAQLPIPDGRVVEVRRFRMGDNGLMISFGNSEAARLRATAALRSANETLERHVAERTVALTTLNAELQRSIAERVAAEAALREAKTAAEQANLSKTRFLAAASHDLLQPLNAGRLFVSALMERRLAASNQALVSQTMSALDSTEELLEALLEISKLDSGASQIDLRDFPLGNLLGSMRAEFAQLAKEKGLSLTIADTGLWVRSDRSLLRRILQNFLSNAVKYTSTGGVQVACAEQDGTVTIRVIDTGPGIPAESHEEIFQEFRRLDRNASNTGMGLGLAIVERASRTLGHTVALTSAPGQGSTFAISLPAGTVQPFGDPVEEKLGRVTLSGRSVLVIDNDASILRGMIAVLSGWGCNVIVATGEAEARVALRHRKSPPDFVLVDYHLDDDKRGDEVLRNLAGHLGAAGFAIVLTADRTAETKAMLARQGLTVLSKPVRPAQLRALMSQMLSKASKG